MSLSMVRSIAQGMNRQFLITLCIFKYFCHLNVLQGYKICRTHIGKEHFLILPPFNVVLFVLYKTVNLILGLPSSRIWESRGTWPGNARPGSKDLKLPHKKCSSAGICGAERHQVFTHQCLVLAWCQDQTQTLVCTRHALSISKAIFLDALFFTFTH